MLVLERAQDLWGVGSSRFQLRHRYPPALVTWSDAARTVATPLGGLFSIYGLRIGAQSLCGAVSMTGITTIKYA
jgi:hypothetical protein